MTPIYFHANGFSFGWFSNENGEPAHVHVFKGKDRSTSAKFWLKEDRIELAHNKAGFSKKELKQMSELIASNRHRLIARWYSFFNTAE